MKTKLLRTLLLLALTLLLCIGMNNLAFLITPPSLIANTEHAVSAFAWEGATPEVIGGYPSARLDNFTAVLMLKTAAYNGPEPLMQKALGGKRIDLPAATPEEHWPMFCTYADNLDHAISGLSYARYWHGYTLPLRLLLCVFELSNIQMLLLFMQTSLFAALCALAAKRCPAALPGFVLAFFFLMPSATGVCLQYAPVTLLMLLTCVPVMTCDRFLERAFGLPGYFALVGMMTNYIDLLTFPLITLGFPLLFLACQRIREVASAKALLTLGVSCSLAWALGYGGMWALKWLLCALFFGTEYLRNVLFQITLRTSSISDGIAYSRLDAVKNSLNILLGKTGYRAALLAGLAASLCSLLAAAKIRKSSGQAMRIDLRAGLLLLPALIPILWTLAMANHALDHTYFTYRNMTVCVFAGFSALSHLIPIKAPLEKTSCRGFGCR